MNKLWLKLSFFCGLHLSNSKLGSSLGIQVALGWTGDWRGKILESRKEKKEEYNQQRTTAMNSRGKRNLAGRALSSKSMPSIIERAYAHRSDEVLTLKNK